MSFATGFVTGLAKSVDESLKKSMERTQERIDGMAQYRVTRRRAALERQDKEKDDLRDVLVNLASLVDGDIDKAAQLYKAGGGTIAGGQEFFKTLSASAQTLEGFDIEKAVPFATENVPQGLSVNDYVNNFVKGISKLPVSDDEVPSTGLYGALFKPKVGEQISKIVESTAPLPTEKDKFAVFTPKVDYSQLLAYKKYQKDNKRKPGTTFESELISLNNLLFDETDENKKADIRGKIAIVEMNMIREANLKKKATGSSSNFSKEGVTNIFKQNYLLNLDKKYVNYSMEKGLTFAFKGNEVPVLEGKKRALQGLASTYGELEDTTFNNKLQAEINIFNQERSAYITEVRKSANLPADSKNKLDVTIHTAPPAVPASQGQPAKTTEQLIQEKILNNEYNAGDLVNLGNNKFYIVTATGFL